MSLHPPRYCLQPPRMGEVSGYGAESILKVLQTRSTGALSPARERSLSLSPSLLKTRKSVRIPGRACVHHGACVHHASVLYFPGTCNPTRAVQLPDIGVPHYVGVPHRVTYPYSPMRPSVLAVANVEGVHNRTTQTLFEVILLPQHSPRSYIAVIASPLILRPRADVHTSPPTCPLQGRRAHVSPNFSDARETCIRLPQLFSFKRDVNTSPQTFPTQGGKVRGAINRPVDLRPQCRLLISRVATGVPRSQENSHPPGPP